MQANSRLTEARLKDIVLTISGRPKAPKPHLPVCEFSDQSAVRHQKDETAWKRGPWGPRLIRHGPPSGIRWRERGREWVRGCQRGALGGGGWMADNYLVHKTLIWRYFVIVGARCHTPSHTITQWIYSKWLFQWSWPYDKFAPLL